jgi:hypothetical protein
MRGFKPGTSTGSGKSTNPHRLDAPLAAARRLVWAGEFPEEPRSSRLDRNLHRSRGSNFDASGKKGRGHGCRSARRPERLRLVSDGSRGCLAGMRRQHSAHSQIERGRHDPCTAKSSLRSLSQRLLTIFRIVGQHEVDLPNLTDPGLTCRVDDSARRRHVIQSHPQRVANDIAIELLPFVLHIGVVGGQRVTATLDRSGGAESLPQSPLNLLAFLRIRRRRLRCFGRLAHDGEIDLNSVGLHHHPRVTARGDDRRRLPQRRRGRQARGRTQPHHNQPRQPEERARSPHPSNRSASKPPPHDPQRTAIVAARKPRMRPTRGTQEPQHSLAALPLPPACSDTRATPPRASEPHALRDEAACTRFRAQPAGVLSTRTYSGQRMKKTGTYGGCASSSRSSTMRSLATRRAVFASSLPSDAPRQW